MSQSRSSSIVKQMNLAYRSIVGTITDEEMVAALEKHGFSEAMLEQGETIYEAAALAVGSEIVAEEELQETQKEYYELQKDIRSYYTTFLDLASSCFEKEALQTFILHSGKPKSAKAYYDALKSILSKLTFYPELRKRLEIKGFGAIKIQEATASIKKFEKIVEKLHHLESNLENALKKRNTALFTLRNWLFTYSETVLDIIDSKPYLTKHLDLDKKELYTMAQMERKKGGKMVAVH